jgi:hypothetical protein
VDIVDIVYKKFAAEKMRECPVIFRARISTQKKKVSTEVRSDMLNNSVDIVEN